MLRLNPNRGEYCMYCYCYRRDWLDRHLNESRRGIRVIDADYNELFRLKDGGKLKVTFRDGTSEERTLRYIDPTHFEYGSGSFSIFHIAEFAEWIRDSQASVEPAESGEVIPKETRKNNGKER